MHIWRKNENNWVEDQACPGGWRLAGGTVRNRHSQLSISPGLTGSFCDKRAEGRARGSSLEPSKLRSTTEKTDIRSFLLSGDEQYMSKYQTRNQQLSEQFGKLDQWLTTEEGKRRVAELHQAADA